jgi:hypothetical protein
MPDFEEGRTETVDMDGPADVTEVMANTPVAVALLEVFASNRGPQGSIAHHSDGRASSRLFADDLADLKSAAADKGSLGKPLGIEFFQSLRRRKLQAL